MNFNTVSLLSLLSFTSLITSPAMSLDSDDEDTSSSHSSPIPSPHAASPTTEQKELDILLSMQKYPAAFASLRISLPGTCPDEEIVKFLLSSNGYSKYDTLSLTEKKWVAARIADKEVDIADTTPKSSTPKAPAAATVDSKVIISPITTDPSESSDSTSDKTRRSITDIDREIEENGEKVKLYIPLAAAARTKLLKAVQEKKAAEEKLPTITDPQEKAQQEEVINTHKTLVEFEVKKFRTFNGLIETRKKIIATLQEEKKKIGK